MNLITILSLACQQKSAGRQVNLDIMSEKSSIISLISLSSAVDQAKLQKTTTPIDLEPTTPPPP